MALVSLMQSTAQAKKYGEHLPVRNIDVCKMYSAVKLVMFGPLNVGALLKRKRACGFSPIHPSSAGFAHAYKYRCVDRRVISALAMSTSTGVSESLCWLILTASIVWGRCPDGQLSCFSRHDPLPRILCVERESLCHEDGASVSCHDSLTGAPWNITLQC